MTGYGVATRDIGGLHVSLEIRALNSRYFKAQIRVPEELQGLEAELESLLSHSLSRGSIILTIRSGQSGAGPDVVINHAVLARYLDELRKVPGASAPNVHIDIAGLLTLPGVVAGTGELDRIERMRAPIHDLFKEAMSALLAMRDREGRLIQKELHAHCALIGGHLAVAREHVPIMIDLYQTKLRQRMEALLAPTGASVREEDVLREVAVFAERSDIAEEVARLSGHIAQFAELVDADGGNPVGRTLDFIAQEMLREANTIASKCLDVEVARRIVEIKGAIDRIKEQVQNVE